MSVTSPLSDALGRVRVDAAVAATFTSNGGATQLTLLHEQGGYRAKFPAGVGPGAEVTIVNTGGGVAGGDRLSIQIAAEASAAVTVATPSAERIYRSTSHGAPTDITVRLRAGPSARLLWAPKATLLFNGARLTRRFDVDLAADARFLMAEAMIFGRRASGETVTNGLIHDIWRVRRGGHLRFADATRLTGNIAAHLARSAVSDGAGGVALILALAPGIEQRLDAVRAATSDVPGLVGCSAWDGMIVVRCLSSALDHLHLTMRRVMQTLDFCPMPVAWQSPFADLPAAGSSHRGAP